MAKDRTDYYANYHKENYVKSTKVQDRQARELVVIAYHTNLDEGHFFKLLDTDFEFINGYDRDYIESLMFEGWSDIVVFDQNLLGRVLGVNQKTISRDIVKFIEQGYLLSLGKYHIEGYTYDSGAYMVNVPKIQDDFTDVWFEEYYDLGQKYYGLIQKQDKKKIELNNKCMQQSLFQKVKELIDEYNNVLPDFLKIYFLVEDNGNYTYSRYYSKLCDTKNPEKNIGNTERYDLLRKFFNKDANFVEYDVNSMMLRTNYNLINEEPLSKDKDVYYELYLKMVDNPISQSDFKGSKEREFIKSNVMSTYMDVRSVYCKIMDSSKPYSNELNIVEYNAKKEKINDLEKLFGMSYSDIMNKLKESLYLFLSVYDFNGDLRVFIQRMFFKYEAIVYYYMSKTFLDMGISTINVYDAFYFIENECNEDLFYDVYNKAITLTKELLNEYNHDLVDLYGKTFNLKLLKPYTIKKTNNFVKINAKYTNNVFDTTKIVTTDVFDENNFNMHIEELKSKGEKYEF